MNYGFVPDQPHLDCVKITLELMGNDPLFIAKKIYVHGQTV